MEPRPAGLRPMREHDLAQVVEVEGRAYEFPWSQGIFADCLRVGYCCWTLAEEHAVVGYCIMAIAADEAHVLNLCVDPARRRRGYGRRMLDHMVALARDHRATIVFLEVRPSNAAALHLYAEAGFERIAVRRNYYPAHGGGREDALVLALRLPDAAGPGG